jgi:transcriptional regulator with GAF, ATPase, and Fis domain
LPPLRERLEEIPLLVGTTLRRHAPTISPSASFLEAALVRAWPGNVRELVAEVRRAAERASAASETTLTDEHLSAAAGGGFDAHDDDAPDEEPAPHDPRRLEIERAMIEHDHNVTAAAKALGMHRTQLYRALRRFGLKRT